LNSPRRHTPTIHIRERTQIMKKKRSVIIWAVVGVITLGVFVWLSLGQ
jgi:hypothetical protein